MCEKDVYFQAKDLPNDLASLAAAGTELKGFAVAFELAHTPDGKPQARSVMSIAEGGVSDYGGGGATASSHGAGGVHSGEVKSYNDAKGFGFLSSPSVPIDIYFQKKDVPAQLQGHNITGMTASFSTKATPDGKLQAQSLNFKNMPRAIQRSGAPTGKKGGGKAGGGWEDPMQSMMEMMGSWLGPMLASPELAMQMMMAKGMGGKGSMGGMSGMGGKGGKDGAKSAGGPMSGVVKNYNAEKGYGFISAANMAEDIYFKCPEQVAPGTAVVFRLRWSPQGKPQAFDVSQGLEANEQVAGVIKSYNSKNGYGFIQADGKIQDIYFKKAELPEELQDGDANALVGCTVHCAVALQKDAKPIAKQMVLVAWPEQGEQGQAGAITPAAKRARVSAAEMAGAHEQHDGLVVSYNALKGFGFISCEAVAGDVYFKRDHLPAESVDAVQKGTPVRFVLKYTPDGKPQASAVEV
uniref:CSD domain-containing protein n=1 Tax=Zooxanthella nutricula TaxID=1333877 RepID=A0A7S2JAZ5_9DINO